MEEYISKKQFTELSSQIHLEIIANKFDEEKVNELRNKLTKLKHLRAKSMILETNDNIKEKGL